MAKTSGIGLYCYRCSLLQPVSLGTFSRGFTCTVSWLSITQHQQGGRLLKGPTIVYQTARGILEEGGITVVYPVSPAPQQIKPIFAPLHVLTLKCAVRPYTEIGFQTLVSKI